MNPTEQLSTDTRSLDRFLDRLRNSIIRAFGASAERMERRTPLLLFILLALYIDVVKSERLKPLWHDELYTFYIAQAHSFRQMLEWTRTIDLNPPLYYIAARITFHFLHPGPLAVRIPSLLGYFIAILCAYQFVRRRLTPLYGLLAGLVLLTSPFNLYSYEARPYAIVLGFLGILALGWQRAIEEDRPRSWLALLLIVLGGFGMLLSHVLAAVAYASLLLTELIRSLIRRRSDWPLWVALLLPLTACITYLQPIQNHDSGVFPQQFQASINDLQQAYADLWVSLACLFAAAMVVIILLNSTSERPIPRQEQRDLSWAEKIFALGLCCVPLVVILVFMHSHSAYFPRYGMPAAFGIALLVPWFIARWTQASSRAALICCLVFCFGVVTPSTLARHLQNLLPPKKTTPQLTGESTIPLAQVMPNLPFVDASGLTFLEMNSRENSLFLSRVYYLTDIQAAVQYANATIFEGFPYLKGKFPIQAHIMPYEMFIQQHSTFLVLGTYNYPEDWLLRKLLADHATLRFLGDFSTGYKDQQLYEVTLAGSEKSKR